MRRAILSGCERVARETWLAGLDVLRGLPQIDLKCYYGGEGSNARGLELTEWLRERLPGTRINMNI